MPGSARTKNRFLLIAAVFLGASLALAAIVLSFDLTPDLRKIPVLQELRLMVYRIGNPAQIEARETGASAREIVLHNPMGLAADGAGNLFVGRGRRY